MPAHPRFSNGQTVKHRLAPLTGRILHNLPERGIPIYSVKFPHLCTYVPEHLLYPIPDFTPAKYSFAPLMYLLKAGTLPPLKL
jgi:hypothetical protein